MLRETVTVSFGEGNSAVNVAWEHGDFDGKQDTENAYSDFVLTTCDTHSSNFIFFDYHQSRHACIIQHQRYLHNTVQWEILEWMKLVATKYVDY